MMENEVMCVFTDILLNHYNKYPLMREQDFIKLIYQSEFGSHFNIEVDQAVSYLMAECQDIKPEKTELMTDIGCGLVRVNLAEYMRRGLSLQLLGAIFARSSTRSTATTESLENKFNCLMDLCERKMINISPNSMLSTIEKFKRDIRPVSHTASYAKNYHPHYRVVKKAMMLMMDCIQAIEDIQSGNVLVCIEGNSGSGKSYYASVIKDYFGSRCNVFSTDDFFLPRLSKTPQRLAEIGGNVDYERLHDLIANIQQGEEISYKQFSCATQSYSICKLAPAEINIIEGVYSAHPTLIKEYDLVIRLTVDKLTQQRRIFERDGKQILELYNNEWLPLENKYLDNLDYHGKKVIEIDTSNTAR
ncbi:MAG: hypothetical protein PHW00_00875 [Clostridia bacterium]|nr:hypothetical protein [Clostridia bacterium]